MKKNILYLLFAISTLMYGCESYLEQDPEVMNSMDKIFASDVETIKWFNRIYSAENDGFMVKEMHYCGQIPYFWCTDEAAYTMEAFVRNVSEGLMSPDNYYGYTGYNLYFFERYYKAIRHINLFLENMDRCTTLGPDNARRMRAEARFMRAYYHWLLLRLYGPIPIVDKSRGANEIASHQARNTFTECVDWISDEIDWAIENGMVEKYTGDNLGFPDIGAARAIQSRMYLLQASPLVNGNTIYANWKNNDGTILLPQKYDKELWKKAADAAYDVIKNFGYELLKPTFDPGAPAQEKFYKTVENYRDVSTTYSSEMIWGYPNRMDWYGQCAVPGKRWAGWNGRYSLPLEMANDYFMADGTEARPLEEWFMTKNFSSEDVGKTDWENNPWGIFTPEETFWMFIGREPRFYASMHFPNMRVTYCTTGKSDDYNKESFNNPYDKLHTSGNSGRVDFWSNGVCGLGTNTGDANTSGLSVRKIIPTDYWTVGEGSNKGYNWQSICVFPIIRLGEIYLNYAEALNEYYGTARQSEVLQYLNAIRERAGIPGYTGSYSQDEMREMIHHERKIELAYECNRYFDVKRWFEAHGTNGKFNHNEVGLDMSKGTSATDPEFFTLTQVATKRFDIQHYFLPIRSAEVTLNRELVQAPFY